MHNFLFISIIIFNFKIKLTYKQMGAETDKKADFDKPATKKKNC